MKRYEHREPRQINLVDKEHSVGKPLRATGRGRERTGAIGPTLNSLFGQAGLVWMKNRMHEFTNSVRDEIDLNSLVKLVLKIGKQRIECYSHSRLPANWSHWIRRAYLLVICLQFCTNAYVTNKKKKDP